MQRMDTNIRHAAFVVIRIICTIRILVSSYSTKIDFQGKERYNCVCQENALGCLPTVRQGGVAYAHDSRPPWLR